MPPVPVPTIDNAYCSARGQIEGVLRALTTGCTAYAVPNDTMPADLLSAGFPDGIPQRCEIALAVLVDGSVFMTWNYGAFWNQLWESSTSIIADFPVGTMFPFAGNPADVPANYLLCDGRPVNRSTYADLFAVTGTAFGIGDGTTTFNLPDTRRRFWIGSNESTLPNGENVAFPLLDRGSVLGAEEHTLNIPESPQHNHSIVRAAQKANTPDGGTRNVAIPGSYNTSVVGGGQAHNNLQPYLIATKMIKY